MANKIIIYSNGDEWPRTTVVGPQASDDEIKQATGGAAKWSTIDLAKANVDKCVVIITGADNKHSAKLVKIDAPIDEIKKLVEGAHRWSIMPYPRPIQYRYGALSTPPVPLPASSPVRSNKVVGPENGQKPQPLLG